MCRVCALARAGTGTGKKETNQIEEENIGKTDQFVEKCQFLTHEKIEV